MKKLLIVFVVAGALVACNNSGNGDEKQTVDSISKRDDTLKHNVDSSAAAKKDSIDQKAQELKGKFDSATKARKDSVQGKTK
jgi:hypothetical protein